MKNTFDSHFAAEKTVDRIKNMEPVQLMKMIQPGMELWKIIDRKLIIIIIIIIFYLAHTDVHI